MGLLNPFKLNCFQVHASHGEDAGLPGHWGVGKCSSGTQPSLKSLQGTLSLSLLVFTAVVDPGRDESASWSRAISLETPVLEVKFCHGEPACASCPLLLPTQ